ncbi:MAG: NADase-type glycan-binding domain-containing protein [Cytophagaceae bacterium]
MKNSNLRRLILFITLFYAPSLYSQSRQVYLDGLYATSTALPFDDYDVTSIFDENNATYWKTIPGAGPDEGIMLYFSEPTYISAIETIQATGDNIALVTSFDIYGNGQSFYSHKNINKTLSSLYIKINNTRITKSPEDPNRQTWSRFHSAYSVSISELKLFGESGLPLKIISPVYKKGSIKASSELKPEVAYGAVNLMNCHKEFAWAEGAKGKGIGESVSFTTENEITIGELKIWNGYQRSTKHFSENARVKTFRFGKKGGVMESYTLSDKDGGQNIRLKSDLTGKSFLLIIDEVYPGSRYEDLVISELHFLNGKQHMLIRTPIQENWIKELKAKNNDLLKNFLDRNIVVTTSSNEVTGTRETHTYHNSSLIIRSNYSFVLYQINSKEAYDAENDDVMSDRFETIADGGWELIEEGPDFVKIRIFGKRFTPLSASELYKGKVTNNSLRVFQDFLILRKDKITGERFIDDIIFKK